MCNNLIRNFVETEIVRPMNSIKMAPVSNYARRRNPVSGCPLTAALAAIGGKWKLIIVYWLVQAPKHFAALRQLLPGISQKVLTQQLRELVNDGIVRRQPTGRIPAPVVYSLTNYGRSVSPIVEDVLRWGRNHMQRFNSETLNSTLDVERLPRRSLAKTG
jgi:DNA-binding HxlR family transcriptional regulator